MSEVKLWEQGAPYYNASYGQPEPTLAPYLTETLDSRGCVIVCPGGGYGARAPHEGEPISLMLNKGGIHSFVLNYRVSPYRDPVMLTDVLRAIRYVRYHSGKYGVNPDKIGVLGFSAGGHLAVTAMEHYDYGKTWGDEIDRVSSRPDAAVLCYPVVSFINPTVHVGSMKNLLGDNDTPEMKRKYSGELSVRDDGPPVFMWHTDEDDGVHVSNCLDLAAALHEKKIPYELHVFPYGEHGLGLAPNDPHVAQWAKLLINWLKLNGF